MPNNHILEYLGSDFNTYVNTANGSNPSNANTQSLALNGFITTTIVNPNTSLAEQNTSYPLYEQENHKYYKWDWESELIVEDNDATANRMPKYLTGWETNDGTTVPPEQQLTQQFIEDNFNGGRNLNLYGQWETTCLIRVIMYIPSNTTNSAPLYTISFETTESYDNSYDYPLGNCFKQIVDTNTDVYYTDGSHLITESATGNGCPITINNTKYITYFGVKQDDSVSIIITPSSQGHSQLNNYIPFYENNNETIEYQCFVADGLVRNEKTPEAIYSSGKQPLIFSSSSWKNSALIDNISEDKTIFIPLKLKPVVTVTVSPLNSGTVNGAGFYFPGTQCTLTATPASGYTFSEWQISSSSTPASSANPYSFTVYENVSLIAFFVSTNPRLTISWMAEDGTVDLSSNVGISVNRSAQSQVSDTPEVYTLTNNSTVTIDIDKIVTPTGQETVKTLYFNSIHEYSGTTRNPQIDDSLLASGTLNSGVSFTTTDFSINKTVLTLDFSNAASGSNTQLYVYYNHRQ